MFSNNNNFSERTLAVINVAREEARRLGHNFIGSEMLLLGLLSLISIANLSLDAVREQIFQLIGRGPGYVSSQPPFTPNASRVLERANTLANEQEHLVIEPEHLLLALTEVGGALAVRVLENLGVEIAQLREAILAQIQNLPRQQPESQQTTETENQSSQRPILLPSVRLVNPMTRFTVSTPPKRINLTVLPQESGRFVCEAHASGNLSSGIDFSCIAYGDSEFHAIASALESLARSYRDFRVQS